MNDFVENANAANSTNSAVMFVKDANYIETIVNDFVNGDDDALRRIMDIAEITGSDVKES